MIKNPENEDMDLLEESQLENQISSSMFMVEQLQRELQLKRSFVNQLEQEQFASVHDLDTHKLTT